MQVWYLGFHIAVPYKCAPINVQENTYLWSVPMDIPFVGNEKPGKKNIKIHLKEMHLFLGKTAIRKMMKPGKSQGYQNARTEATQANLLTL